MSSESLQELQVQLNELLETIVDTIATFDGRFAFSRVTPGGTCTLSFLGTKGEIRLVITATVQEDGLVSASRYLEDNIQQNNITRIYEGSFDKPTIRETISTSLAAWYGELIRNQGV